jgi:hypothetical protein
MTLVPTGVSPIHFTVARPLHLLIGVYLLVAVVMAGNIRSGLHFLQVSGALFIPYWCIAAIY